MRHKISTGSEFSVIIVEVRGEPSASEHDELRLAELCKRMEGKMQAGERDMCYVLTKPVQIGSVPTRLPNP